jgi:hypothetical protein
MQTKAILMKLGYLVAGGAIGAAIIVALTYALAAVGFNDDAISLAQLLLAFVALSALGGLALSRLLAAGR